jgi:Notch-like protein
VIDPCQPNPCHNESQCIRSSNWKEYACNCSEGFVGEHCEQEGMTASLLAISPNLILD